MPVLVTGATGVIGRALVPALVDTGGQVRVYVRRDVPEYRAMGVKVAVGDADHEGRLESALEQVHTLVHLIGGPLPERGVTVEWLNVETVEVALRAAVNAEVRRVLFVVPLGADPTAGHPYLAAAGRAEQAVSASGLEFAILRCSPVIAPDSNLTRFMSDGPPARVRDTKLNPVAVADVVAALVAADTRDAAVRSTWELGGPEVVTVAQLAERWGSGKSLLSRPPRVLVELYEHDAVADPTAAFLQLNLSLTPLDAALVSASR